MSGAAGRTWVQYHGARRMGWVPLGPRPFGNSRLGIVTRKPVVRAAVGGTVLVVVCVGTPKRYYLWERFVIDEVRLDGEVYCASGDGWMLGPPARLEGPAFRDFQRACANFVGFRSIDDLEYTRTLLDLSERCHQTAVTDEHERFCTELLAALPASGDVYFARAWVRHQLRLTGALDDAREALRLGTEYADEARAILDPPHAPR